MREVLMRYATSLRRVVQLQLFHPLCKDPLWGELPLEIRQQTVRLLARLLREHGKIAANRAKEARDE
jgi:hypothetical protein